MSNHGAFIVVASVFMLVSAFSLFYWTIVKPVLIRRSLYHLFKIRDVMRWAKIEGKLDGNNEHVQMFERILGAIIANSPQTSFLTFIFFSKRNDTSDDIKRFCDEAPDIIKRLTNSMAMTTLEIMLINSPVLSLIFFVVGLSLAVTPKRFIAKQTQKESPRVLSYQNEYHNAVA